MKKKNKSKQKPKQNRLIIKLSNLDRKMAIK